jgi:hypothetical protein
MDAIPYGYSLLLSARLATRITPAVGGRDYTPLQHYVDNIFVVPASCEEVDHGRSAANQSMEQSMGNQCVINGAINGRNYRSIPLMTVKKPQNWMADAWKDW